MKQNSKKQLIENRILALETDANHTISSLDSRIDTIETVVSVANNQTTFSETSGNYFIINDNGAGIKHGGTGAYQFVYTSIGNALTATGTSDADAYSITKALNKFNTVPSGTGCILPYLTSGYLIGATAHVFNNGANTLKIYALNSGTVDGGASIDLAAGSSVLLIQVSSNGKTWVSYNL